MLDTFHARAAVRRAFGNKAVVHRCQWHKRENVVEHLPKGEQAWWRKRLQRAYERPTYAEAKTALKAIRRDLEERNLSAVGSLDEGFEETLTLHRLGVFPLLGISLKTTNCLESIFSQVERRTGRVSHWKNSWRTSSASFATPSPTPVRGPRYSGVRP